MKKTFLLLVLLFSVRCNFAQIIYNNSFNNLSLQTYSTSGSSTKYSNVPAGYDVIDDGYINNPGSLTNPNKPFNCPGFSTTGWAVVYNDAENDTFLVSTSWLDTTLILVNRWVITPFISNISANTVLTWVAKCPDPSYADGYEVYATTTAGGLTPQNFTLGDRIFALADANTAGGGEKNTWTRRSVSLGAFAGQSLRFAFRDISTDMYQLWIDDIKVLNVNSSVDVGLSAAYPRKYILVNTTDSVNFNISNYGATTVNYINVSYQIGNSSINTENINITNGLSYGQDAALKFALPYTISSSGLFSVKCWINSVNGVTDQYLANDTCSYMVTIQNSTPPKTVLFEQFVSANNGEGPDAQEKTLTIQSSSLIIVNFHAFDSLRVNNSVALINDYEKNIPTGLIDRTYFADLQAIDLPRPSYNHYQARINAVTPASVTIVNKNYNPANRQLTFNLKVDFVGEVKGDFRLNAYLTENYVSGPVNDTTVNGYNQLNNYFDVPWSSYYEQGYYSSSANTYVLNYWQYQHQNTLVYAFDGAYGSAGVIPASGVTQGQSFQQTFSLTVPTPTNGIHKFNPDNLYIVGFLSEYSANKNNRNVLNAVREKVTSNAEAVGIQEGTLLSDLLVYPNPSRGFLYLQSAQHNINYEIGLFDLLGKRVKNVEIKDSRTIETLDLSALPDGVYILKVNSEKGCVTQKVIIQK